MNREESIPYLHLSNLRYSLFKSRLPVHNAFITRLSTFWILCKVNLCKWGIKVTVMNFSPLRFLIYLPSLFIIFFSLKLTYTTYTCFVFTKFFGTTLTKSKLNFISILPSRVHFHLNEFFTLPRISTSFQTLALTLVNGSVVIYKNRKGIMPDTC